MNDNDIITLNLAQLSIGLKLEALIKTLDESQKDTFKKHLQNGKDNYLNKSALNVPKDKLDEFLLSLEGY